MNTREKLIELVSVTMRNDAGYPVFENLNFIQYAGETVVISGASGSGKTALAELIIGERSPERGAVQLFGHPLNMRNCNALRQMRRRIGGVGGIFSPLERRTVSDNLLYPLLIRGDSRAFQRSRLKQLLTQFNLLARKHDKIYGLPRGERLMLMFARAVIADQPLLIIDEPLDLLDRSTFEESLRLFRRLSAAGHALLILTTGQKEFTIPGATAYKLIGGQLR